MASSTSGSTSGDDKTPLSQLTARRKRSHSVQSSGPAECPGSREDSPGDGAGGSEGSDSPVMIVRRLRRSGSGVPRDDGPEEQRAAQGTPRGRRLSFRQQRRNRRLSDQVQAAVSPCATPVSARAGAKRTPLRGVFDISSSDDAGPAAQLSSEDEGEDSGDGDGDSDPSWLVVGAKVDVRWEQSGDWLPGKVMEVKGNRNRKVLVEFPDGEQQESDLMDVQPSTWPLARGCQNAWDEITGDNLKTLHVCYCTPDGRTQQCFNLNTLRQIAFTVGETGVWKQPPHFRTPMEASLRKQIACRFGPSELNLQSEHLGNSTFKQQLSRFQSRFMGRRDLHACPICYTWLLRDLEGTPREKDPMSVLCSTSAGDGGAAQVAFTSKKHAIEHLKEVHLLDIPKPRAHTELLERYMVRKTDGLLQNWLHGEGFTDSSAMWDYWRADGNAAPFLAVLCMAEKIEKGYSTSLGKPFPPEQYRESQETWESLAGGGCASSDDEEEFLVEDGESEGGQEDGLRPRLEMDASEDDDPLLVFRNMRYLRKQFKHPAPSEIPSDDGDEDEEGGDHSGEGGDERPAKESPGLGAGTGEDDDADAEGMEYDSEPDDLDLAEQRATALRSDGKPSGGDIQKTASKLGVVPKLRLEGGSCESNSDDDDAPLNSVAANKTRPTPAKVDEAEKRQRGAKKRRHRAGVQVLDSSGSEGEDQASDEASHSEESSSADDGEGGSEEMADSDEHQSRARKSRRLKKIGKVAQLRKAKLQRRVSGDRPRFSRKAISVEDDDSDA